ncbi:HGxxPAAW family protein [Cellulomonas fimi]|uniref:Uncharacterized protein n=1 Tax=Cellulomonas fimi TaxID=1708 RepID=A0A7Y0LYV3_CELFI|nr:HGxxPAAW family protein [Cellulomonas fimi]NMR20711.1 hypothetical protein [Cellulomonas fimi]
MVDPSLERSAPRSETSYLPPAVPWTNHGHTLAAWVTVTLVLVGGVVSAVGVIIAVPSMVWAGLAVVLVGLVAGKALQVAGYGQGGKKTLAKQARARAEGRGH